MDLEELIASIDIVDFISHYVELHYEGGQYWGLSCFKTERTPSFAVRQSPPLWHDFSSGKGGNVYNFVREYYHCGSREAIEKLRNYAGITDEIQEPVQQLSAVQIFRRFQKPKPEIPKYQGVILKENILDKYIFSREKLKVWEDEGISIDVLKKYKVLYDPLSNRLVYPVRNVKGEIVNIAGRTLDPGYKAKGIRKYTYFYHWGTMDVIYGLYEHYREVKDKNEIILFEGCKSVFLAETWGIQNTGAILTSHLNPHQLKLLVSMGCDVVFALDKDVDIRLDKNINKLRSYTNIYVMRDTLGRLDDKDAPVDKGEEVFRKLYEDRTRLH